MNVSATSHLTTQMVTAAALRAAADDGDGRTGAAALNDGDAASIRARATANPASSAASSASASRGAAGRLVDVHV